MHREPDLRYPLETTAEQMEEAPPWARRLAHNVEFLVRRVAELDEQLATLGRRLETQERFQEAAATREL